LCHKPRFEHGLPSHETQLSQPRTLDKRNAFGFYSCTVLPMGVMPATDIFQSRIVSIFTDMGPELPIPYTKENKKRLGHIYKVDDLILIIKKPYGLAKAGKISSPTYSEGPYRILKLYKNGTVKIQRGSFTDIFSIRRIMKYYSRNN
jgi:hypothetical protein